MLSKKTNTSILDQRNGHIGRDKQQSDEYKWATITMVHHTNFGSIILVGLPYIKGDIMSISLDQDQRAM